MSRKIDLVVVTKKQQHLQCLFGVPSMLLASKETWMTSFGRFSTFHEDSLPSPLSLDAEMTLSQSGNDKIPGPSRQLHQQLWRRSTIRCILTSKSASKYFLPYQSSDESVKGMCWLWGDWKHIYEARCHRRDWQDLPCSTFITTWPLTLTK